MNRIKLGMIAATALIANTGVASAHDNSTSDIDARRVQQEKRIREGVRSGELTGREYYKLEKEQAQIRRMERDAKADGYVSSAERARIKAAQNQASRDIYAEKHDGEKAWWRRWYYR